jgi:hypothetical protein
MINEEHLTTVAAAHLQTIPFGTAHERDGVPGNDREPRLYGMLRFPPDAIGGGMELRDRYRKFRGPVDALDVGFVRLCIQNNRPHGIVNRFTEQESLFVVFWGNSGGGQTGKAEPFLQRIGRGQKVSRLSAAMPHGGNKVERQAAGVKSELAVFGVRVFASHVVSRWFCNHIYGYILFVNRKFRYHPIDTKGHLACSPPGSRDRRILRVQWNNNLTSLPCTLRLLPETAQSYSIKGETHDGQGHSGLLPR